MAMKYPFRPCPSRYIICFRGSSRRWDMWYRSVLGLATKKLMDIIEIYNHSRSNPFDKCYPPYSSCLKSAHLEVKRPSTPSSWQVHFLEKQGTFGPRGDDANPTTLPPGQPRHLLQQSPWQLWQWCRCQRYNDIWGTSPNKWNPKMMQILWPGSILEGKTAVWEFPKLKTPSKTNSLSCSSTIWPHSMELSWIIPFQYPRLRLIYVDIRWVQAQEDIWNVYWDI